MTSTARRACPPSTVATPSRPSSTRRPAADRPPLSRLRPRTCCRLPRPPPLPPRRPSPPSRPDQAVRYPAGVSNSRPFFKFFFDFSFEGPILWRRWEGCDNAGLSLWFSLIPSCQLGLVEEQQLHPQHIPPHQRPSAAPHPYATSDTLL